MGEREGGREGGKEGRRDGPVLGQVGDEQGRLPALAQKHAEDFDLLSAGEEEGHGHARDAGHLDVVDQDGELMEGGREGGRDQGLLFTSWW